MAEPKVYPKGIMTFPKHEKAPDFVKGSIAITLEDLREWLKGDGAQYLTEYNGKKQLKLQILDGQKGLYLTVDTYKKGVASDGPPAKREQAVQENYGKPVIEPLDDDDQLPF